jgi:hypothetical protein
VPARFVSLQPTPIAVKRGVSMKRILLLLIAILFGNGSIICGAAVRYDAKVWRSCKLTTLSR